MSASRSAAVIAETLTAAQDAAEKSRWEYDELPAVTDARDALKPDAPQLYTMRRQSRLRFLCCRTTR